jgi:4-aminobutyrate aminotransferase
VNSNYDAPRMITDLPGPKARAIVGADREVVSPSLPRAYPLVADHAKGCVITDVDGNRFLDFAAGAAPTFTIRFMSRSQNAWPLLPLGPIRGRCS